MSKFVCLEETDLKDNTTHYYFLQYTGNENTLNKLKTTIDNLVHTPVPDLSSFYLDLKTFYSKEIALAHLEGPVYCEMFCGKMKTVKLEDYSGYEQEEDCMVLDQFLCHGQIKNYF